MRTICRTGLVLAAVVLAVVSVLAATPQTDGDDQRYNGEIDLYGYEIVMMLQNPSQVSTVEWDFGDGSEHETVTLTADNPNGMVEHTYSAKGDYVVTATMRNQYTDPDTGELKDGEATLVYLYHILGFPVVSFDSKGGSAVASIEGTSKSYVPSKPGDPSKAGFSFTGWYADEGCTKAFDWTSEVSKHTTLYAGWEAVQAVEYTSTLRYDANGGTGAPADDTFTGASTDAHVFTVASAVPVKDGYRFEGWADTSDASEAVYKAGSTVSVEHNGTKTIHAVWKKIMTVTADAPSSVVVGSVVTITFTVNEKNVDYMRWMPDPKDMIADGKTLPDNVGGTFTWTFKVVRTGTLGLAFTAEKAGCVDAVRNLEIQILSNGVTAPPSAKGIEAVVKG